MASNNPYSYESQSVLSKIRDIRAELNRAEDLLRQGKLGATSELLDADFFHFCEYIRMRAACDVPDVPQQPPPNPMREILDVWGDIAPPPDPGPRRNVR